MRERSLYSEKDIRDLFRFVLVDEILEDRIMRQIAIEMLKFKGDENR